MYSAGASYEPKAPRQHPALHECEPNGLWRHAGAYRDGQQYQQGCRWRRHGAEQDIITIGQTVAQTVAQTAGPLRRSRAKSQRTVNIAEPFYVHIESSDLGGTVNQRPEENSKKPHTKPCLRLYGDIREVTAMVSNHTKKADGGVMAFSKTA
jgi:hypothetical protein